MLVWRREQPPFARKTSPMPTQSTQLAIQPNAFFALADMMVVGIGGSSGGLDAFTKFVRALPPASPIAFILVQHLDPAQQSLLVELLQPYTSMPVRPATDGASVEPGHLYVIEPGTALTIADGRLRVSHPKPQQGPRLPFDALLRSLASVYGDRAACVILSGTGADGSTGLKFIAECGGFVVV